MMRDLTADDMVKENNAGYDLGRKHAKEELEPVAEALRRLYLATAVLRLRIQCVRPELKSFSEWETCSTAMLRAEQILDIGKPVLTACVECGENSPETGLVCDECKTDALNT